MAVRTFRKHIIGLKFPGASGAPKPRRDMLDGELATLGCSARRQRLERELQRLRHHTTERPDPQADHVDTLRPSL
jgi:hypothetical protein